MSQDDDTRFPIEVEVPLTLATAQNLYLGANHLIKKQRDFYDERIPGRRILSFGIRALGAGAVVASLGVLAVYEDAFRPAYFLSLFGGVALSIDQWFLFTKNYMRFSETKQALESHMQKLNFDWLMLKAGMAKGQLEPSQSSEVIQLLQAAVGQANALVAVETSGWRQDLESSIRGLTERLDTAQRDLAKGAEDHQKAIERRDEESRSGALNIELKTSGKSRSVIIEVSGEQEEVSRLPGYASFEELEPGFHTLRVKAVLSDDSSVKWSKLVKIQPGSLEETIVNLP